MRRILILTAGILIIFSCIKKDDDLFNNSSTDLSDLQVSDDFEFKTSQEVAIELKDNAGDGKVRYDIYTNEDDINKNFIGAGTTVDGIYKTNVTVSSSSSSIKVIRKLYGTFEEFTIDIENNSVYYDFATSSSKKSKVTSIGCHEKLYAVNSGGGFYTINIDSNYIETQLPNLQGGGSIACAVDRANRKCYYNVNQTLYYYDIDAATFNTVHTSNPFNGSYPRLEYDNTTGLCYMAKNEVMYKVNPTSNEILQEYDILGLESPVSGGDVAISLDGSIYMCCFSGLYKIELTGDVANATRISAENLPFQPTSMAIDRNDKLYLATNDANSELIIMDKFDGAWQVVNTYNHKINDLGSLPCLQSELDSTDSDNDGVIDSNDDFPDDADKAFSLYTPSDIGWGSLGFEDLWPAQGDYDFNDLVVNYRVTAIANAQNEVVELVVETKVAAIGASLTNGFGIEFPFAPDVVASVTGTNLTENMITNSANGTEANQTNAVVIFFDNAFENGEYGECASQSDDDILTVRIEFTTPQPIADLADVPYNPFIFVSNRGHEVHLKNKAPTDLVDTSLFKTLDDASQGSKYYMTENGLPWGINIIHNFRHMKEKRKITKGYLKFFEWSSSEGNNYTDWYKDNSGFRNTSDICID